MFSTLASGVTDLTYTATGLTFGTTYEFKVESRNSYGYSDYSGVLSMLCAFKPEPPLTVTTENQNDIVKVVWDDPVANGSPITGFRILVREHDEVTFTQESVQCDGTDATIISTRICYLTLQSLRAEPYLLVKDDSVYVRIISENFYGDSIDSAAGNGAVIQYVPDAPISLQNDLSVTTDTVIRFTWLDGISNGGTPVIDFAVYYDEGAGTDSFVLLDGAVTDRFYVTSVTLTPGATYRFKVTARNTVGTSLNSATVSILAAKEPDAPINLSNVASVTTAY